MTEHSDIIDVQMLDSSLILDPALLVKIGAVAGDRIVIGYIEKDGIMIPIISKGEEGNKLTKSNSISFRGKQKDTLGQFGSQFWAGEFNGSYCELEGNGIPVYSSVEKAVQAYISKEIVLDTNYNITYRTEFEF